MTEKNKPWLAVEDGSTVRFSDLAHMIAKALHPSDSELLSYGAARINLESELAQAVKDGVLLVRNPAGMGRHTFPVGDALRRAVLIPNIDLEPFLSARGIELRITPYGSGPQYWTIENAAAAIQEQEGWHDGTRAEFKDQLVEAAESGALVILNPRTLLPTLQKHVRPYYELVTPAGVNTWLASQSAPYRWNAPLTPDAPQHSPTALHDKTQAEVPKPLQRLVAQERAILAAIRLAGHDPKALPKNPDGKPGVKAEIRAALRDETLFTGVKKFDSAWQRLRDGKDIRDAD